jgi:hypothetical protein
MRYNPSKKAFITDGNIGLGNILKNEINREFPGMIKIEKTRNKKDRIYIYLSPDPNTWYFFEFVNGTMKAVSSNQEFNNIIKELKPKSRKQDVEKGPSFQFTIGSEAAKNNFVRNNMTEKETKEESGDEN